MSGHHSSTMDSKKSDKNHLENLSKALNKAREYIILLLTYFLYKIMRSIVTTTQKFTWAVTGVERTRKDAKSGIQFKHSAHVHNVLWRRKLILSSVSDPSDFILTHKFFKHPNYVLKPNISLYCITKDEALFVEVAEDVNLYKQFDSKAFYMKQFERAHSVISMPLASFHKIAQDIGRPKVPIIWMSSTGSCGATLLSRVFGQLPGMAVISDPDALTSLAFLKKSNKFGKGEYEQLLPSALRLLCKHDDRAGIFFVKTRPCSTCQMADVYKCFPQIYHLYIYRNSFKTVTSHLNIFAKEPISIVGKYVIDSQVLSAILPCFRKSLYHNYCYVLERTDGNDNGKNLTTVGIFATSWAANIVQCLDHVDAGVPVIAIMFEEMMKNPQKILSILFDVLELRQEYLSDAMEGFRIDPCNNNVASGLGLNETRRPISHQARVEADAILKKHGLPKLGERFEIPGLLDFDTTKFRGINTGTKDRYY
ncbi:uncharacterized protein LOC125667510 [Ostrea edulis]|uniref:uncharacterized protein LOC125667510 n=1 Tax=Ostrea edulis TaxID=37623 RepID=UPI0024AF924A|nr:uncharacterized protein LOC125667510 [Ostrea edulis]